MLTTLNRHFNSRERKSNLRLISAELTKLIFKINIISSLFSTSKSFLFERFAHARFDESILYSRLQTSNQRVMSLHKIIHMQYLADRELYLSQYNMEAVKYEGVISLEFCFVINVI